MSLEYLTGSVEARIFCLDRDFIYSRREGGEKNNAPAISEACLAKAGGDECSRNGGVTRRDGSSSDCTAICST